MAWQDRDYNREGCGTTFGQWSGMSVVSWLIIANSVIWVWDAIFGGSLRGSGMALGPYGAFSIDEAVHHAQLWRWVTYQFIHANFLHVFFNMLGLFYFGPIMENWWGSRKFLPFYLLCGMSGAVVFTILGVSHVIPADGYLVGASGAIFGILIGCAVVAPNQKVMLLIPPIPMTMRTMAMVYLAIAALTVIVGGANSGGEATHLGGAALGFLLVKWPGILGFADRFSPSRRQEATEGRWMKKQEAVRRGEEDEQAEVDRILDKVRDHGLHSLSRNEKKILQRATEKQRRAG